MISEVSIRCDTDGKVTNRVLCNLLWLLDLSGNDAELIGNHIPYPYPKLSSYSPYVKS